MFERAHQGTRERCKARLNVIRLAATASNVVQSSHLLAFTGGGGLVPDRKRGGPEGSRKGKPAAMKDSGLLHVEIQILPVALDAGA